MSSAASASGADPSALAASARGEAMRESLSMTRPALADEFSPQASSVLVRSTSSARRRNDQDGPAGSA
jgi:hypothetical protein